MEEEKFYYVAPFSLAIDVDDKDFNIAVDYLYDAGRKLSFSSHNELATLIPIDSFHIYLKESDSGEIEVVTTRELDKVELENLSKFFKKELQCGIGQSFEDHFAYSWYNDHTGEEEYILPSFVNEDYVFELRK